MYRHLFTKALGTCAVAATMIACSQNVAVETGDYKPDWESLRQWECPEWFQDAKFGLWAHWGPQNQAEAGDWYARHLYYENHWQGQHHRRVYGSPSEYGLKDLCNDWKAEEWNPDELIKLFKSVGARYFMSMGNHHDNFDNWNSPYQEWNSVNVGPKKDIIKGWAEACKEYGLPFGVSFHASHAWSWLEIAQKYDGNLTKEDGKGTWWEGLDPQELYAQNHEHSTNWENDGTIHSQWNWGNGVSQPSEEYKMKFQNRVLECVNTFNPDMLYFDDTVMPFYGCDDQIGLNILSHFYNKSAKKNKGDQSVVVMGKVLEDIHKDGMLWDVERGAPDRAQELPWQTCTCIGGWHYNRYDYNSGNYKSAEQVISMLVDIVSKNGNLLLSVPMRASGSIDEKVMAVLEGIKEWMDVNGVSIYGTRPWKTFGEGPVAEASNPINAQGFNENNNYSAEDIRFVQRNDTVFTTIMRWPRNKNVVIKSFGMTSPYYSGKVKSVELLGYGSLQFENGIEGLSVTLPEERTNKIAPVLVVTFENGSNDGASLATLVEHYTAKVKEFSTMIGENTGNFNAEKLQAFANNLKECTNVEGDAQMEKAAELNKAFAVLKKEGINKASAPDMTGVVKDLTKELLVEEDNFTRMEGGNARFGKPRYWTVENFVVPNGNSGVKNGLDRYSGKDCLMLGVWNDRRASRGGDLENARLYRKVKLDAGRYYFGAKYNAIYSLDKDAYIFASNKLNDTKDIPSKAIAHALLGGAQMNGDYYGISFTLTQPQEVVLGFQIDLKNSSATTEMRAETIKLLYYGK